MVILVIFSTVDCDVGAELGLAWSPGFCVAFEDSLKQQPPKVVYLTGHLDASIANIL
jgi:hypothetical protein